MQLLLLMYPICDQAVLKVNYFIFFLQDSFKNVSKWLEDVDHFNSNPGVYKALVGNKADLQPKRVVTFNEAKVGIVNRICRLKQTQSKHTYLGVHLSISKYYLLHDQHVRKW